MLLAAIPVLDDWHGDRGENSIFQLVKHVVRFCPFTSFGEKGRKREKKERRKYLYIYFVNFILALQLVPIVCTSENAPSQSFATFPSTFSALSNDCGQASSIL